MDTQEIKNWIENQIQNNGQSYSDYCIEMKDFGCEPEKFSEWLTENMFENPFTNRIDIEHFLECTDFFAYNKDVNFSILSETDVEELQNFLNTALDEADEEYRGYRERAITTEEATGKSKEELMEDYLHWYDCTYDAGGKVDTGDAIVQDDFRRFLNLKSEPKDFMDVFMELEEESGNNPNPEYPTEEE